MVSNTKEQALEAAIEQALTGQCLETLGNGIGEGAAVVTVHREDVDNNSSGSG